MTTKTHKQMTREVVAEMMRENTGKHMLDSGGIYGYRFEERESLDFDALPEVYVKGGSYAKSLYHHLVNNLIVDEQENVEFIKFAMGELAREELERFGEEATQEMVDERKEMRAKEWWVDSLQAYCEYKDYNAVHAGNTCNHDSVMDGVFQWFEIDDATEDTQWAVISTHNGCDHRGGYSKPVFFKYTENYREDSELLRITDGYLWCETDNDHRYETYDGYHWNDSDSGVERVELVADADGNLLCPKCQGKLNA